MILHVAKLDKFIPPFIELVDQEFDSKEHLFYILNVPNSKYKLKIASNVKLSGLSKFGRLKHYFQLSLKFNRAKKIILHGLFDFRVVVILALMPWLLKKCYWVLWGGDLYRRRNSERNLRWYIHEFFRTIVIRNFKKIVTTVPGDYDLAVHWYGTKAGFKQSLMYTSHVSRCVDPATFELNGKSRLNIQLGNSADPENRHIEIFNHLKILKKEYDFQLFCPLSYGNKDYAEEVINEGNRLFMDSFYPMEDFMSFSDYTRYMDTIDIAIFNHQRQQAMGNIIGLLSLGKTVYLPKEQTPYEFLTSLGITVYATDVLLDGIKILSKENSVKNQLIVNQVFSRNKLISSWEDVFNE